MSEAKAIFTLDGFNIIIQCSPDETMRDICQRFAFKTESSLNSLIFLWRNSIKFRIKI